MDKAGASGVQGGRSAKVNVIANRLFEIEKRLSMAVLEKEEMKRKVDFQHKEIIQIMCFLGDIETRLEALRFLGTSKGTYGQDEYESVWDKIKGLRVKEGHEVIAKGDFVRVSYVATVDDKVVHKETSFPLRVGAGVLTIEEEIEGLAVNTKAHSFVTTYPENFADKSLAGKAVTFLVDIDKVKTRIEVMGE